MIWFILIGIAIIYLGVRAMIRGEADKRAWRASLIPPRSDPRPKHHDDEEFYS